MDNSIQNLLDIENKIKSNLNNNKLTKKSKIIAVSKTFGMDKIMPLIEHGHIDFGENKVQEAVEKWTEVKKLNTHIQLHLIGRLQTNKVKFAVKLFDYIHSVDSQRLAKKISDESSKLNKKIKIFIQVNIGDETQKSGVNKKELDSLVNYCLKLNLELIGLMCIPPEGEDPSKYFIEMNQLNHKFELLDLSMGMSGDYLKAVENSSTFLRIGSSIFGQRN